MRAILAGVAALALATPATAQAPRLELRGLIYGVPSTRITTLDPSTVGEASGTMAGGEVSARGRNFGVLVRLLNGDLAAASGSPGGDGTLTTGEVRLQLGPRLVAAEAGYARRAIGGILGTTVYSYVRAGAASALEIGGTGLTARVSAALYLAGQGVPDAKVSGHEIVTALEYAVRRTPIVVMLGYRAEVFQVTGGGTDRAENVSGLVLGGGVRLIR